MAVLLAKAAYGADLIILYKDPDDGHQPSTNSVEDPVVAERAADDTETHEVAQPVDDNHELARLEAADGAARHLVGRLLGVGSLELLGDLRLGALLDLEPGREDGTGEDNVDANVLRVQQHLLRERVGEAAQRPLGGGVARVAGDGVERDGAGRHDEVLGLLLDRGLGREPRAQDGVRHVGRAVKVDVHLAAHRRHVRVEKELGYRDARDAPDNVRSAAAVPGRGVGDDGVGIGLYGDVGCDVVESLGRWVLGGGLGRDGWLAVVAAHESSGRRTLTALMASSSLAALRETRIRFAPLAESCVATERPMPSDPPVIRTVYSRAVRRVSHHESRVRLYLAVHWHPVAPKETHCVGDK